MRVGNLPTLFVLALLVAPPVARAQALSDLSLEELMRIDAGRVFGASERIQPVTEVPASVSFITAEDIARHGYRTLADILRGVRGMYVTDDRNFSYLGARGFAKPGDYNSRILLLVNGHRVNDNVFGQAEIGAEFGMDPAIFERVEIIRGPASSLYGDSAFFAVVNVITRKGASLDGASVAVEGGSLDTARSQASIGRRLANGLDFVLSGTYELVPLPSGGVRVVLSSEHRVSTPFNFYASMWTTAVMRSIQSRSGISIVVQSGRTCSCLAATGQRIGTTAPSTLQKSRVVWMCLS